MQFAINYSPQAADLLDQGAIQIDRFKCASDWPHLMPLARAHSPIYVHFTMNADPKLNRALDVDAINALCEDTNTPYINLHLSQSRDDFPNMPLTTTDRADQDTMRDYMLDGVNAMIAHFGTERVIVENIPYSPRKYHVKRPCVEPAIIREVVETTGVGFLLDISHARLSAHRMGIDPREYLEQLPGEAMRELHITGIGMDSDGTLCDHLGLSDADWPLTEWVFERIRAGVWAAPWIVSFEYGGLGPHFEWRSSTDVIAAQVPRLYALAHGVPQTV